MLKELKLNKKDELCLEGRAVLANQTGRVIEIELPRELLFAGDRNYLELCIEQRAPEKAEAYLLMAEDIRSFPRQKHGLFYWVSYYSLEKDF